MLEAPSLECDLGGRFNLLYKLKHGGSKDFVGAIHMDITQIVNTTLLSSQRMVREITLGAGL